MYQNNIERVQVSLSYFKCANIVWYLSRLTECFRPNLWLRLHQTHCSLPQQIFAVFVRKHAVPVNKCEDDKHVWLLGRKVTLKFFLNHGPFLSWSGFETACNKFKIAAASATAFPQLNEVVQMPELSDRRPVSHGSSPTTLAGDIDWTPRDGYLLSAAQARIAFVSACTPGPVVASFPEGSSKAAARATDGGPENETSSCEQEDAYWRVGAGEDVVGRTSVKGAGKGGGVKACSMGTGCVFSPVVQETVSTVCGV